MTLRHSPGSSASATPSREAHAAVFTELGRHVGSPRRPLSLGALAGAQVTAGPPQRPFLGGRSSDGDVSYRRRARTPLAEDTPQCGGPKNVNLAAGMVKPKSLPDYLLALQASHVPHTDHSDGPARSVYNHAPSLPTGAHSNGRLNRLVSQERSVTSGLRHLDGPTTSPHLLL